MKFQKLFYQGYILPLIAYGSNTWGATSKNNIERIFKLQKRAARIILHADYNTPSSEMLKKIGMVNYQKSPRLQQGCVNF